MHESNSVDEVLVHAHPEDEDLVQCVDCKRMVDPDEANCPDRGWMCEGCYDARYA